MKQVHVPRWVLASAAVITLVLSTACSCSERLSNAFSGSKTPTPEIQIEPTTVVTPLVIPKQPETPFEGELSEADIENLIKEELSGELGDYLEEIDISISPESMVATAQVNVANLSLTFQVELTCVPRVADGQLFIRVTEITLDDSLSGWTRLSAKSLIQEAIDKYAGEDGILVEFDNIWIEEVELGTGKLSVRGRTL